MRYQTIQASIRNAFTDGFFSPLSIDNYRRILSSNSLWWATFYMEHIAVGWMVLELTDSALMLSFVEFFRRLPFLILGFLAGPIMDRVGRYQSIVFTSIADICLYMLLAMLIWSESLELWHIYVITFIIGCLWGTSWPARRGILPDIVGKERTVDVLALDRGGQGTARIVGPALAGVVVATYGVIGCFVVIIAAQVLNLGALWGMRLSPTAQSSPETSPETSLESSKENDEQPIQESPIQQIRAGLAYARHHPIVIGILLSTLVANLLIFPFQTLLPVFARDVLNQGPVGLGWLGAAPGIGTFLGLLVVTLWRRHGGRYGNNGSVFIFGTMFFCITLFAFAISPIYWMSWSALAISGIGQVSFALLQVGMMMLVVEDEMRNRMMGLLVLAIGIGPFGRLMVGFLAELYGAPFTVAMTSSVGLVTMVLIAILIPKLRRV
ncbi:MAG: MFS transporter [Chloroflexota bacterium]